MRKITVKYNVKRIETFCRRLKIDCLIDGTFQNEKYWGYKTMERKPDETVMNFYFTKRILK